MRQLPRAMGKGAGSMGKGGGMESKPSGWGEEGQGSGRQVPPNFLRENLEHPTSEILFWREPVVLS